MLHPKAPPRAVHSVEVGGAARHVLHVTEYGAADGLPLVYLHGGPGGGTPPDLPRLFEPSTFRLVAFDQRGCGGSRCADRLRANTTADILSDIEAGWEQHPTPAKRPRRDPPEQPPSPSTAIVRWKAPAEPPVAKAAPTSQRRVKEACLLR